MPRLDERLKTVARQIRWPVHADIGSDHGHLLKALLTAGRIDRGIAIENKRQPFENSHSTLLGLNAEVRLADGFAGLVQDEADGVSICGMGARSMVRILKTFPDRVPKNVVVQPNRNPELLRQWGIEAGFHLNDEQSAAGRWEYVIMRFEQNRHASDPAYQGLDRKAAILFGPHFCKRNEPGWRMQLAEEKRYIETRGRLGKAMQQRLDAIECVLSS
ncbi:tRNA (adenine(22)-N(1))-methyltransferase [Rubripirellula obstinata]|uniref:tRNA (Adenine(22)-N(1))-methyltransferase n=1 Tax=Rubripirellula obstinata TaxID=406547 RepID=A0A5B1CMC7_9BACT|nr:class I SAM-dependent methyltransferase [Rubripirellula obstinata]KAA1262218.1 tRNA (adenine(22)-N(1))-methyltransferase [Rubripirellula obstinata]